MNVTALVRRHRGLVLGLTAAGTALVVFVLVWFQPQKLFIDDRVDEPVPVAQTTALPSAVATPAEPPAARSPSPRPAAPQEPQVIAHGSFRSGEHHTEGTASVLALSDGRRFLRLTDFETSNGPVVVVWLSAAAASAPDGDVDDAVHLDLGGLKGNIGNQNYELPADVDLSRYRSVVIWCARFHVAFGAASLSQT
jgi:hypothetical protein